MTGTEPLERQRRRPPPVPVAAVRKELADPLFRNAYALAAGGAVTGVLGLGYWFVAARLYDPAQVGRQAAENQAMMLLGGLTALNLLLVRFLPEMGRRSAALVSRTYLAGGLAAAAVAGGFLLTLDLWGAPFAHLSGLGPGLFFGCAVVAWTLFTTQDGTLTGLRHGTWVLGKGAVFAGLKLVLLGALAVVLPAHGITLSWVAAAVAVLVPVEVLVRRRLVPRHVAATAVPAPGTAETGGGTTGGTTGGSATGASGGAADGASGTPAGASPEPAGAAEAGRPVPSGGQIRRYLVGDYVGTLCSHAAVNLVPVVVATRLDAGTNAYFYLAWVLAATVDLLAVSMAMSLTVEGAHDSGGLARACRAVTARMMLILVPLTAVLVAGAEYGLSIFGPGYAEHGADLLRLLALAVIPKALIELYIGLLRVRRRTSTVALLQAARLAGVLALVLPLTAQAGLAGPGYAVLAVSLAGGLAVLPPLSRAARTRRARPVRPERQRGRRARSWPAMAAAWPMLGLGLALFWLPLRGVHLDRMTAYGLISVLPVATLAGAAVLVVTFMYTLGLGRAYRWLLLVQVAALAVSLHGLAPAVESFARPPTAWQHAGFVDYILRTGVAEYALDARFNWPGFFATAAFLARGAGVHDLEPVLHWAPVAVQLCALVPLLLILRPLRMSWRAKWLAVWLFVAVDWVGQDYFAPQAFGYLLYLVFVAVLLNRFRPAAREPRRPGLPRGLVRGLPRGRSRGPWRGFLRGLPLGRSVVSRLALLARGISRALSRPLPRAPFRGPGGSLEPGERPLARPPVRDGAVLFCFLVAAFTAVTVSHQLTPFLIILVCAALVLVRRCVLPGLPLLLTVIVAAWISFCTAAYWTRDTADLFAGFGRLLANIALGVTGRIGDATPELATAQATRTAIAVFVVVLAVLGAVRRRLRGIDDRVALVLFLTPLAMLALQNYGGEMTLRVYLFMLPGAVVLAAYLFFPATRATARRLPAVAAATACGLAIVGGFLFVRFSNETFEQVPRDDTAALDATLRATPHGRVTIAWLTDRDNSPGFPQMPWGYRDAERFGYTPLPFTAMSGPADLRPVLRALERQPGGYFVTTRAHEAYLVANHRLPKAFPDRLRAALAASDRLRPVRVTANSAVYALRTPPPGNPPPVRAARPFSVGDTPWTPVGLAAAPLLIIVLAGGELRRLRPAGARRGPGDRGPGDHGPAWRRAAYPAAVAVLLLALAAAIAERFTVLGT